MMFLYLAVGLISMAVGFGIAHLWDRRPWR
jgi:hypothetical protein